MVLTTHIFYFKGITKFKLKKGSRRNKKYESLPLNEFEYSQSHHTCKITSLNPKMKILKIKNIKRIPKFFFLQTDELYINYNVRLKPGIFSFNLTL